MWVEYQYNEGLLQSAWFGVKRKKREISGNLMKVKQIYVIR